MSDQHDHSQSSTGQFLVLGIVGLIVVFYFYSVLSKTGHKEQDHSQSHAPVVEAPKPKPVVKPKLSREELEKKIAELEQILLEKNGQLKLANTDLAFKQSELEKVKSQFTKIQNDFSQSQSSLTQTQSKLDLALATMRKLEGKLSITKEQRDHTIQEAEALRSSLVDVKSELNKSSEIIGRVQQILRSEESISQQ